VAACRGEAQRRLEHSGDTAFRLRTELPSLVINSGNRISPKRFGCGYAALCLCVEEFNGMDTASSDSGATSRLCSSRQGQPEISPAHRAGFNVQNKIRPGGTTEIPCSFPIVLSGRDCFFTFTGDAVPG
jgi:hypothetical protein